MPCEAIPSLYPSPWWRHQMETFSALLAICAGNSPVPGEFPTQRPVTRSFDVYFDLRPNKRLSKQSWGWWFETLSAPFWRHRNESVNNVKSTSMSLLHMFREYCRIRRASVNLPFHLIVWNPWHVNFGNGNTEPCHLCIPKHKFFIFEKGNKCESSIRSISDTVKIAVYSFITEWIPHIGVYEIFCQLQLVLLITELRNLVSTCVTKLLLLHFETSTKHESCIRHIQLYCSNFRFLFNWNEKFKTLVDTNFPFVTRFCGKTP